jgi:hypothetical protein
MKSRETTTPALARLLVKHAAWVAPPEWQDWSAAMTNELEYIPPGKSALRWALDCARMSYAERIRLIMTRTLTNLPRWLLTAEMAICLVPLTFLFLAVLTSVASGRMPVGDGLLYGSVALAGPAGIVVALLTLFFRKTPPGRTTNTILAVLAAWTLVAYTGQVLHNGTPVSQWWREFVLIALLPALALVHLIGINSQRQAAPTAAAG